MRRTGNSGGCRRIAQYRQQQEREGEREGDREGEREGEGMCISV